MGWEIADLVKGAGDDTHIQFVEKVRLLAEAEGWTSERNLPGEWIGKSTGLSTVEEIYVGIKAYQDVGNDIYNVNIATFSGYVPGETFENQPGDQQSGVPAHNINLGYYLSVTLERIAFCLRMGSPVYQHGYIGKFIPYSLDGEFPYPVACFGMLDGPENVRFSDPDLRFPYAGKAVSGQCFGFIRNPAGSWDGVFCYPFSGFSMEGLVGASGVSSVTPNNLEYQMIPIVMSEALTDQSPNNVWGELDSVFSVSGFSAGSETVIQQGGSSTVDQTGLTINQAVTQILAVGGRAFVMLQDVSKSGLSDYIALEMS